MGTMTKPGTDIVSFLKEQHAEVKGLFAQVASARGVERHETFVKLQRLLSVHEKAEEEIVHPVARHVLPGGEQIVKVRLQEEVEAKKKLAHLVTLDVDSSEFTMKLGELRDAVVAHSEAEESQEFEKLRKTLDRSRLLRMAKVFQFVEESTPTSQIEPPTSSHY